MRVQRQRVLQRAEQAELHQHQSDSDVEHQPYHTTGLAVGHTGKKVRPGDRAGIGVGDVDLQLRQNHEADGEHKRGLRRQKPLIGCQIHDGRLDGGFDRHVGIQNQDGQERAGQHFQRADHRPARPGRQQREPPGRPLAPAFRLRQKAQKVDLLPDLRDQREGDARCSGNHDRVQAAIPRPLQQPLMLGPGQDFDAGPGQHGEWQHLQDDPQRLRPFLEGTDARKAVGDQRNHQQGIEKIANFQRHPEAILQGLRQDRGFQGKEDEGEAGIDQRGDRRSQIAEAGASGQQVDIHPRPCRVIGDRDPCDE